MVSLARVLIVVFALLTLVSAITGLWIYNSHISPLKALASKPSLSDVLDTIKIIKYTMEFKNITWLVEISSNAITRSGFIKVYDIEGRLIVEYRFNYTKTTILWLSRIEANGSSAILNPIEYMEAFATNIKFHQAEDGSIKDVEPFPGIAPLYALTYIGNATLIDWSTFYKVRVDRSPPQWVQIAFTKVRTEEGEARGVEISIQPQQTPFTTTFKWYHVGLHAKLASLSIIPVAWELTLVVVTPTGDILEINIRVESVKLR